MPRISTKGQAMPDSPIRKLAPFAVAAKAAGRQVLHLNIGQPDIATPQVALDAVKGMDRTVIEYSPSDGFATYREGLAGYYRSVGVDVTPEQIIVTTGGSEALVFAFQAWLEPGDEVIIPEPFYANYNGFATMAGVKVVPVTSRIEDGFALPPVADIAAKVTDRTRAILICNPGNPTGYVYTDAELEAIRSLVLEHDLYLFADEVYREFCYGDQTPTSVLSLPGPRRPRRPHGQRFQAIQHVRRPHRGPGDPQRRRPPGLHALRHGPPVPADPRANRGRGGAADACVLLRGGQGGLCRPARCVGVRLKAIPGVTVPSRVAHSTRWPACPSIPATPSARVDALRIPP